VDDEVRRWRAEIDDLDRQLVTVLALRLTASLAIARRKRALGIAGYDPARERELVDRAPTSVRAIYAAVIRACREAGTQ
jgi:chorismate mutase